MNVGGSQRGIALITAMLITAIIAAVASKITTNQHRISNRTVQLISSDQGILNIWSVENLAQIYLVRDRKESTADFPGEDWTLGASIPVEGGLVFGKLSDETGKFNINNILTPKGELDVDQATRLLNLFRILEVSDPEQLVSEVIDWVDKDESVYRNLKPYQGAEDGYYLRQDPPYRTANRPFMDVSELRMLKSMDREVYSRLLPHVTALPEPTWVNVNFASAEVLRMLDENITDGIAAEILRNQNKEDFYASYNTFIGALKSLTRDEKMASKLSASVVNVKAKYFKLQASVNLSGAVTNATSLIRRDDESIALVWRNFGISE